MKVNNVNIVMGIIGTIVLFSFSLIIFFNKQPVQRLSNNSINTDEKTKIDVTSNNKKIISVENNTKKIFIETIECKPPYNPTQTNNDFFKVTFEGTEDMTIKKLDINNCGIEITNSLTKFMLGIPYEGSGFYVSDKMSKPIVERIDTPNLKVKYNNSDQIKKVAKVQNLDFFENDVKASYMSFYAEGEENCKMWQTTDKIVACGMPAITTENMGFIALCYQGLERCDQIMSTISFEKL